ncbi:MAG: uracil-DNA glycosylase [Halomonadaceae bacterium]|nr:MAG: uracil-DNA glycosylase [Halomonadaceae bacterium]
MAEGEALHPTIAALKSTLKPGLGWHERLAPAFAAPAMQSLGAFLGQLESQGTTVYPKTEHCFSALNATAFESVSVVILGQDPYHGPGQAHGLSFSVPHGVPPPPSLKNIIKELQSDLGLAPPDHGCLQPWAEQGVLLLNSVLTVTAGEAASHRNKGWEPFTDSIVQLLNDQREGLVFVLWGSYAQKKGAVINRQRHLVIEGPHPSPLSAHRGFFGGRYFSRSNTWLKQHNRPPIQWALPSRDGLLARYRQR